ncbi:MAG: UDP-N-acetylmuramoyl-L-alanine--D-glutamate ligase, partial [Zetaproteobacteria bacterium]
MRCAILGMGVTGQSMARHLRAQGIDCRGFDERGGAGMTADVTIGPFDADLLAGFDRVLLSPGIAWDHPVLQELRARHEASGRPELLSDLDLFGEQYRGRLLAVTGTNGKTTVSHLLGVLLETLDGGVEVAGNIGQPMLDLLSERHLSPRVVLELSSFQLQRSRPLHVDWAALLNLQEDHLDHHGSAEAYLEAKQRLFRCQREGDYALLPREERFDALAGELAARGVVVRRFGEGA